MFELIDYAELNSRQQENYNFQKIAARLADYGYNSIRLSDDFEGADFLAMHINGEDILRVQLKGRLCFDAKYYKKGLHIAFRSNDEIFVYPHDGLREEILLAGLVEKSKSDKWINQGSRSWPNVPKNIMPLLKQYKLSERVHRK